MKKLILGVGLVLTVSVINLFNACSADETDEAYMEQTSKKELLLAKSKEFAKKYGVDMEIRKDILDELAQSITIEEMERDFKMYSMLEKEILSSIKPIQLKKRSGAFLKFRTTTTVIEMADTTGVISGSEPISEISFSASHYNFEKNQTETFYYSGSGLLYWYYDSDGPQYVRVSMEINSSYDNSSCRVSDKLNTVWGTDKNEFNASGRLYYSDSKYTYGLMVNASRSKETGVSVTITR